MNTAFTRKTDYLFYRYLVNGVFLLLLFIIIFGAILRERSIILVAITLELMWVFFATPSPQLSLFSMLSGVNANNKTTYIYQNGSTHGTFTQEDIVRIFYCYNCPEEHTTNFQINLIIDIGNKVIYTSYKVPQRCQKSEHFSFFDFTDRFFQNIDEKKIIRCRYLFFWWRRVPYVGI